MASAPPTLAANGRLLDHARTVVDTVRETPGHRALVLLVAGIVAVIVATAVAQVWLNAWNQPFYNAIERRDLAGFVHQLWVFFGLAAILLVLNVTQTGINQLLRLKLRELATAGSDRHLDDATGGRRGSAGPARSGSTPTSASMPTRGTCRSSRPTSASASCSRRSCSRASSACSGCCRGSSR